MKAAVSFVGQSGAKYSFRDIEHEWLLPRTAGLFLYLRHFNAERVIVFVGSCDDLMAEAGERWEEAVRQHGVTHQFVRRVVSSGVRRQERDDLILRFEPVMNGEIRAATGTDGR